MKNIAYFKYNRWYVTKICNGKSYIKIGIERKNRKDFIVQIPNKLYNKTVSGEYTICINESYKINEYDRKEIYFIDKEKNKKHKVLIYEEKL